MRTIFSLLALAGVLVLPAFCADLPTRVFSLDPALVSEPSAGVRALLERAGIPTRQGANPSYFYNDRTGTLHLRASEEQFSRLELALRDLQKPRPLVSIRVLVAECNPEVLAKVGLNAHAAPWESSAIAQMKADAAAESGERPAPAARILTAKETTDLVEKLQAEPGTDLLTLPVESVLSGRTARLAVESQEVITDPPLSAPGPAAREALRFNAE